MFSLISHILFVDYSSLVKMHYVTLSRNDHKVEVDHTCQSTIQIHLHFDHIVDIQCSANRDKNLILTIDFSRAPI